MLCDYSTGQVIFKCAKCGVHKNGAPEDARVFGALLSAGAETREMSKQLIATAGQDRVNQLVPRPCPDCGLDYMAQVRVGDAEVIIYKCKCGYVTGGEYMTGGR